jgi:hypothetical protein
MNSHFETLWGAIDQLMIDNAQRKLISLELENFLFTGGMRIGESWSRSFDIDSLKGRNTKKGLHVTIFRNSKTYEMVSYVL